MGLIDHLTLERMGPAEATIGMVSLPLPREQATDLRIDHPASGQRAVAWWKRDCVPRRVVVYVVDNAGAPPCLQLTRGDVRSVVPGESWSLATPTTFERLKYVSRSFQEIEALRGVSADDCTLVESQLQLTWRGRTLGLQFSATGPSGDPGDGIFNWQNVQLDPLWQTPVAQGVRVGGVVYNGDTYLWADVYLVLFPNGVADVAAHFVTTVLHIEGYDFQGLPLIRFTGDAADALDAQVPADGLQLSMGQTRLNLSDCAILVSEEHPGRFESTDECTIWRPFDRTFNPQVKDTPPFEWPAGFARTVRFQLSLSDAAPVIARYRVPSWWYTQCGEIWPWGFLPSHGRVGALGELKADVIRKDMVRGRFDAGNSGSANDGYCGTGMMQNHYVTGRPELFEDALHYCYYWADLAVDHRDFTVHQWLGGWPWKTCAYSKFRDLIFGYLETGDPYLKDTMEHCAESYWRWFRSNWPRCTIGRDAFEIGGWALLWRYFDSEHARDRCIEFVRMLRTLLKSRGTIGGQMGAGPHPGYHASLYMTGVGAISLLEVAGSQQQMSDETVIEDIPELVNLMLKHYLREDLELFPSAFGKPARWGEKECVSWAVFAARIAMELRYLQGGTSADRDTALRRSYERTPAPIEKWVNTGRPGDELRHPLHIDALTTGARWMGEGVSLSPLAEPEWWPATQVVDTPLGQLTVKWDSSTTTLQFGADKEFPVEVKLGRWHGRTTSKGRLVIGAMDNGQWT